VRLAIFIIVLLCGCYNLPPQKGGTADSAQGKVQQGENPNQATTQKWKRTERYQGTNIVERVTESDTNLGSSWKDTAREWAAKLKSMRGVMWVGVGLIVLGLASLTPYVQTFLRSVTTSFIVVAGGVAMTILPTLIVGHEVLILCGIGGAVALYFFAHRHGHLQGFVDANKDGIDDREQAGK
jgi:hypothetical protein